ncbi:MAG: glycosyltransferase family 39 protein [Candidatus Margulisiibacteriota bacterium]|nr:glycosyltransferase family 39 protein [Candidatus Margulisiibacteriota bacterium]
MRNIIILILLSLVLFTLNLGAFSLWQTDEVIYSNLAKEILQSGDWITLHLNGEPWFIHPPLFMWLTAATGALFGLSNFMARLWCAIFGLIGVLTLYQLGKLFYNERVGFYSGLILATTFQWIMQARLAIFDPPLAALMLLAVYFFFVGYKLKKPRAYWWFYVFLGLAVLMKGPIGILLPLLIIGFYALLTGELLNMFVECHPIVGMMVACAIGGSWYLIEWLIHGQIFVDRVIGYYTVNRFLGVVETHTGPVVYYVPVILIGFLPWTAFLFEGIYDLWKDKKVRENLFVFLWVFVAFLFFSLARTKLPGYILSLYPFLALAAGKLLDKKERIDVSFYIMIFISLFLLVLVFPLSNPMILNEHARLGLALLPLVLMMGVGGLLASVVYFITKRKDYPVYILVTSMVVFLLIFAYYSTPIIEEFKAGWG